MVDDDDDVDNDDDDDEDEEADEDFFNFGGEAYEDEVEDDDEDEDKVEEMEDDDEDEDKVEEMEDEELDDMDIRGVDSIVGSIVEFEFDLNFRFEIDFALLMLDDCLLLLLFDIAFFDDVMFDTLLRSTSTLIDCALDENVRMVENEHKPFIFMYT